MQALGISMKFAFFSIFLAFSFTANAWECHVNNKANDNIMPEDHYQVASDVVFGMIMNGHFVQTGTRTRTYIYTVRIFHSFKGKLTGDQTLSYQDINFFGKFEIGESYLITLNGNTNLEFCDYYFPLHTENKDANVKRIRELSNNSNLTSSNNLKKLFKFFDKDT